MFRPFPLFIGLRYVRARRRTRFISVVSAVALCGLGLGVMALVVVLSVMNGFDRELRSRILALVPHVLVVGSRHRDAQHAGNRAWRRAERNSPAV